MGGVHYEYEEYERACVQFNDDLIDDIERLRLDDWAVDPADYRVSLARMCYDLYDDLTLHELPKDDVYGVSRVMVNAIMPVVESMPETPPDRARAVLNRIIRRMMFEPNSGIVRGVHRFTCIKCGDTRCGWVNRDRWCDRCEN